MARDVHADAASAAASFLAEPVSNVIGGLASFITMLLTVLPELKQMEISHEK